MNTKQLISGIALTSMMAIGASSATAGNPFSAKCMDNGYKNTAACKKADAKCGEGKCGGTAKKADAKCGEGKCGGTAKKADAKCGEGKCGGTAKKSDAKCGEGKCGG